MTHGGVVGKVELEKESEEEGSESNIAAGKIGYTIATFYRPPPCTPCFPWLLLQLNAEEQGWKQRPTKLTMRQCPKQPEELSVGRAKARRPGSFLPLFYLLLCMLSYPLETRLLSLPLSQPCRMLPYVLSYGCTAKNQNEYVLSLSGSPAGPDYLFHNQ